MTRLLFGCFPSDPATPEPSAARLQRGGEQWPSPASSIASWLRCSHERGEFTPCQADGNPEQKASAPCLYNQGVRHGGDGIAVVLKVNVTRVRRGRDSANPGKPFQGSRCLSAVI